MCKLELHESLREKKCKISSKCKHTTAPWQFISHIKPLTCSRPDTSVHIYLNSITRSPYQSSCLCLGVMQTAASQSKTPDQLVYNQHEWKCKIILLLLYSLMSLLIVTAAAAPRQATAAAAGPRLTASVLLPSLSSPTHRLCSVLDFYPSEHTETPFTVCLSYAE